jgi:hypothetical protein
MVPHTLVLEHVSPATRLLEKRRQMFEVQEALEQQKQEFARKVDLHLVFPLQEGLLVTFSTFTHFHFQTALYTGLAPRKR